MVERARWLTPPSMPKSSSASSWPSRVVRYTALSRPGATAPQPCVDAPRLGVQAVIVKAMASKVNAVKSSGSHRDGIRAADTAALFPAAGWLREGGKWSGIAIGQVRACGPSVSAPGRSRVRRRGGSGRGGAVPASIL